MTKYVAFLRNVNLGQRGSPTRGQLEFAFLAAGAGMAASFMSNGTVVFTAGDAAAGAGGDAAARSIARRAAEILATSCGLAEPLFVCRLDVLARLVAEGPFAPYAGEPDAERSITFFDPPAVLPPAPIETPERDCLIFHLEPGLALSLRRSARGRGGYPTPVVEALFGRPATTRGWNTILRLVARHGG